MPRFSRRVSKRPKQPSRRRQVQQLRLRPKQRQQLPLRARRTQLRRRPLLKLQQHRSEIRFVRAKKYIYLLVGLALLSACEQKETTVTNPPAEKKESNTTVVNPSPATSSKTETDTTINTSSPSSETKTESSTTTTSSPTP